MGLTSVPTVTRPGQFWRPQREYLREKEGPTRGHREPPPPLPAVPPLEPGDHLSRAEFERRYEAHPEIAKAELVEGVVYLSARTHVEQHGRPHAEIAAWLGLYQAATTGVMAANNSTVRLDYENEVQPDVLLRLEPVQGGRSRVSSDDYLEGPPELIVEVMASSAAYDLHAKRRVYQRSGVREYLALQVYEREATWFVLREEGYEPLATDAAGILRSELFPGLWLNVSAFWAGQLATVLATLQEGLTTPEHAAFVVELSAEGEE